MAVLTISAAGGNSNVAATYDEVATPTASDDIVCRGDGTSGPFNIVAAMSCRSLDFTNYSNTLTFNSGFVCSIGTSTKPASAVALKLVAAMTLTLSGGTNCTFNFISTTTGNTVTTAGKALGGVTFNGALGAWTVTDSLLCDTGRAFTVSQGTVDCTGITIQAANLVSTGALTRALTITNATLNLFGTASMVNLVSSLTLTATGSTINVMGTGNKTFTGAGKTFGTLAYTSTATGSLTIVEADTFAALTVTGAARTLTLPSAATTTVTALTLRGVDQSTLLTINSSTPTSAAVLSVASGTVYGRFLSITDNTAQGGATFRSLGSTLVSNTSGWTTFTFFGTALNDQMLSSLRATYSSSASLQDLLTRFETDNTLKGQQSWFNFYGGSGAFNDRAYAYWSTH